MKLRVLVAEDNNGDVILFREAFAQHQIEYELYHVSDGEAALRYIAQMGEPGAPPCPDILLLDLNLPKVDGTTVLSEFRRHPQCARTPVVVVTSSDAERDRASVGAYRITRYFRKPSDFDDFMQLGSIVRELIENPK